MNTTMHFGVTLVVGALTMMPITSSTALADDLTASPSGDISNPENNLAKQWLRDVWRVFRIYSPERKDYADERRPRQHVVVAGLRGAPSDEATLQPYWQGGLDTEYSHLNELEAFEKARSLAEQGQIAPSVAAFKQFISQYPDSGLGSSARIALGALYAELGEIQRSTEILSEVGQGGDHLASLVASLRKRLL